MVQRSNMNECGKFHGLRHKQSPGSECKCLFGPSTPPASLWGHGQSFNHVTRLLPLLPFTTPMGSCLITINVFLIHDKLLAQSTYVIVFLVRTGWKDGVVLAHHFFFLFLFIFFNISRYQSSFSREHRYIFLVMLRKQSIFLKITRSFIMRNTTSQGMMLFCGWFLVLTTNYKS